MKTINQNKFPYFQHKYHKNLKTGVKYAFSVKYSKYVESENALQLVFILNGDEEEKFYYLLENFIIGSERYNDIVRRAYTNEDAYNCVIDVNPEDFKRFYGECSLMEIGGRLHIDINSIEVNSTPCSSMWHNQAVFLDYFDVPSVEEIFPEDEFKNKPRSESAFFVQPTLPEELQAGRYYDFTIKKAHTKADGTLQVVFALCDDENCHWLLEEFTPGTPRFNAFISEAYSVPAAYGTVIEFIPEDLCGTFSGSCKLEERDGFLKIDWGSIHLFETLLSDIFDEQVSAQRGGEN